MTRWFTTLLYALMLACAALPVQAAAAVMATVAVAGVDAGSQDTGEHGLLSAEAADPGVSSNDGNMPEVPELFFEDLPCLALPVQTAEAPPSIAVPLSPHPFLKGPQRPPRTAA
ncbi:hypothetical protein BH11PSE10_BH11PSE10_12630 [soil metagenome]